MVAALVEETMGKTKRKSRKRRSRKKQTGGALARHKVRLVDKIAEGAAMTLSGPSPSFLSLLGKLGGQAAKGVKDNVDYYRRGRQRGGGIGVGVPPPFIGKWRDSPYGPVVDMMRKSRRR